MKHLNAIIETLDNLYVIKFFKIYKMGELWNIEILKFFNNRFEYRITKPIKNQLYVKISKFNSIELFIEILQQETHTEKPAFNLVGRKGSHGSNWPKLAIRGPDPINRAFHFFFTRR